MTKREHFLALFSRKGSRSSQTNEGVPPKGRSNQSDDSTSDNFGFNMNLKYVEPAFYWKMVPEIRKLLVINSPLGTAITTLTQLSNTGYNLTFSNSVSSKDRLKMSNHIQLVAKEWAFGTAGIHGIVDKMIYQILIGGAHSGEWVIKNDLSGVDYLSFIKPEQIRPVFNKRTNRYDYYQAVSRVKTSSQSVEPMIKLNSETFRYFALINDIENPTAIPPFLSALPDLSSQKNMLNNINFITEQVGLMGFLELLLEKPSQEVGEANLAYRTRLNTLLTEAKTSIQGGLKDGVIAGYKNDHEFNFQSISKDLGSLPAIFAIIQKAAANGLQTPSVFLEAGESKTETQISIIFTKLIAQLKDIQNIVAEALTYGFMLELTLAGFNPEGLRVAFDPSTITDKLKNAQADEIITRVQSMLYASGIIDIDTFARNTGYDKADKREPRVPLQTIKDTNTAQVAKDNKSKKNNEYDKTVRDKKKDQPKPR